MTAALGETEFVLALDEYERQARAAAIESVNYDDFRATRDNLLTMYRALSERLARVEALCPDWRDRKPLNKSEAQLMRHATYRQCADEIEEAIRAGK